MKYNYFYGITCPLRGKGKIMSLLRKAKAFKNWYMLYLLRYGFVRDQFELISRRGERISVRPRTADVGITKSVFAKKKLYE